MLHKECTVGVTLYNLSCSFIWGFLRRFQHCTGHITTGSLKGRGNQYIQFARVVYCKLPTNGKQLPAFPLKAVTRIEPWPQRWEARVLPLCHRGPSLAVQRDIKIPLQVYFWTNVFKAPTNDKCLKCCLCNICSLIFQNFPLAHCLIYNACGLNIHIKYKSTYFAGLFHLNLSLVPLDLWFVSYVGLTAL